MNKKINSELNVVQKRCDLLPERASEKCQRNEVNGSPNRDQTENRHLRVSKQKIDKSW